MILELRLPSLGEGITDATLTRWLFKEGDTINKNAALAEIATDKVDTEILSPADGFLRKILKPENTVIEIGEIIGYIVTEPNEVIDDQEVISKKNRQVFNKLEKSDSQLNINSTASNNKKENIFISPFVRTIALEYGLTTDELYSIKGTGENSRITKEDIIGYINSDNRIKISQPSEIPSYSNISELPKIGNNEEVIELDRVRKVIAENMVKSKHISPHVASFVEVNVSRLVNWRNKHKESFKSKYHFNLTYLPFIVEAVAKALKEFPKINAVLNGSYLILKKDINIGIATALPDGNLVVPVIKNAHHLNWLSIAQNIYELSQKAKSQDLQLSEIQNGTFTVTNAGTFGNIGGTPIILQPQLAILAVGSVVKKPVAIKLGNEYGVGVQDIMELWLSYDHRVIDGFLGGSFLKLLASYIEEFDDSINL